MYFHRCNQRVAVGIAILAVTFAALGCGKNRVNLDVDVTSFIAAEDLSGDYQSPAIPLTVNLDPIEVNLLEGSSDFVNAEELSIDVAIEYDNDAASSDGDASFTLFFADTAADLFDTAAVVTIPAVLVTGEVTSSTAHFEADPRVLSLFTQEHLFMGISFTYTPAPGSSIQLLGTYTITSLMAHVVSNVEIF